MSKIDELLMKPYWIIDIRPKRVPENAEGQYFAVEKYFRTALRDELQLQKLSLMLKQSWSDFYPFITPEKLLKHHLNQEHI